MIPPLPDGYKCITAIIAIAGLEAINMLTLQHNGILLEMCLIAIAALGGWGARKTYERRIQK